MTAIDDIPVDQPTSIVFEYCLEKERQASFSDWPIACRPPTDTEKYNVLPR